MPGTCADLADRQPKGGSVFVFRSRFGEHHCQPSTADRYEKTWKALSPVPGVVLTVLGISAGVAVVFVTILTLYSIGPDNSMQPNFHVGDWVVSLNAPLMKAVHRGEQVAFFYGDSIGTERSVGLAGDRIQVRSGKLIKNGSAVSESYCRNPYRGGLGDFPLPSDIYPDSFLRSEHQNAYRESLRKGSDFVVPEGSYFLLNDDRNELLDSRIFGPVRYSNISGIPLFAYDRRSPFGSANHGRAS